MKNIFKAFKVQRYEELTLAANMLRSDWLADQMKWNALETGQSLGGTICVHMYSYMYLVVLIILILRIIKVTSAFVVVLVQYECVLQYALIQYVYSIGTLIMNRCCKGTNIFQIFILLRRY